MTLFKLIRKELAHRKVNFSIHFCSYGSCGSWLLSDAFLTSSNLKSEEMIQAKVEETEAHSLRMIFVSP